ncbi:hypothetical protein [Streptomyces sp. SP2-10]|uniref:hypothetical protein n=1 Tax=Streptomyces sp. SP2-10 TaxID=2873385 RepID=UPI001CA5F9FD|nr:hypothetical protein [Streptomyces sp. SP2-10]MBY8844924.1 hypothetical protein [Streptomyces sp. SP2-10]
MATKTADGAEAGTEAHKDDETTAAAGAAEEARTPEATETRAPEAAEAGERATEATADAAHAEHAADAADDADDAAAADDADGDGTGAGGKAPSGVGQGAGAVVSAALGLVSLSGGWIGTVASAREQLVGQLQTSSTASVAKQVKEVYGDAWHTTALWAGLFAVAALVTGVVVLVRPAFGAPGRPQAAWIKSVAWAGVSLGVIGLLLAVLKYSDALLALPSAG